MILTPARAGLARSGATRSGYPVAQGKKMPLYALSNVARSGATRSNYTGSKVFIDIGGVPVPLHTVLIAGASITDTLDETPTTGSLSTFNFHPVEGQEVIIRLGSKNNARRLFAGTILAITRRYEQRPANGFDDCRLIDYTWGLGKRQVRTRYVNTSVAAIVANLVATYASGYTWRVEADIGAELVDEITFTETSVPGCLTQLARRVGGSWQCDYQKVVQVFYENTLATNPSIINAVHPTLLSFESTRDLSQIVTRVLVEAGGVNAFANCAIGETILPLDGDPGWYSPSGGTVVCGPQRLTYTGVSASTGGGMVGPGAAPSGAPVVTLAAGSGIETGTHKYAVTFTTASGESVAGPLATIDVGAVPAPPSAPVAGTPQGGLGPEVGTHGYAVTFVTASGETVAGPTVSVATGIADPPSTSPLVGVPTPSASGVDAGLHEYAVSFVNANGETTPGPIGAPAATAPMPTPTAPPTATATGGTGLGVGTYQYAYTDVSGAGETTTSPGVAVTTAPVNGPTVGPTCTTSAAGSFPSRGPGMGWPAPGQSVTFRVCNFDAVGGQTMVGPLSNTIIAQQGGGSPGWTANMQVNFPAETAPGVVCRLAYMYVNGVFSGYSGGGGIWFPGPQINGFPPTAHYCGDVMGFFGGQAFTPPNAPPASSTAANCRVSLGSIAVGPPGTTARRVYRTPVNGSVFKLAATINDNTTTTVIDALPDASLGVERPFTNTAGTNSSMPLSNIEKGPAGTSGRNLYRRSGGAPGLKFLTAIANNSSTTYTDTTPNASLGAAPPTVNTATTRVIPLSAIPVGGSALVTARKVYRTAANAAQLKLVATLADNTTTTFLDTVVDASLGANAPTVTTATANQVALSAIPIGAATVTSRKLYRTAANASQLKLLTTLANNTATTYTDSASLAALGANVPVSDTSGLTQPSGSVNPGVTVLQIANIGPFPAAGWAVIGNGQQVIRYSGVSGNTLTGIPASGPGAIVAAISYNSTVTAAPVLTGIPASGTGSIRFAILRGDEVNTFVTVNDPVAQAALAAMIGGDGIQESYIQDRRLSIREATARGQAHLELKRDVGVEVRFQTRDINTRAGSTVTVNLGAPFFISADFIVQQVTITFLPSATLMPVFTATASSYRLSFEDLLRAIKAKD